MTSSLANPWAHARIKGERIDMGVDYAGTGEFDAPARGVVTQINPGGWGKYGNFVAYQVTDKASPLYGRTIYSAEGVRPASGLKVGSIVNAGQALTDLIPGWWSGTEEGFAGTGPDATYAQQHGGYTEGKSTVAGEQFNALITRLGGPAGQVQAGGTQPGTGPSSSGGGGGVLGAITSIPGDVIGGITGTFDVIGSIANFVQHPERALLTIALVGLGALLIYSGVKQALGLDHPVASAARGAAGVAALA